VHRGTGHGSSRSGGGPSASSNLLDRIGVAQNFLPIGAGKIVVRIRPVPNREVWMGDQPAGALPMPVALLLANTEVRTVRDSTWLRVGRDIICPICGRHGWCLLADDGSSAICARVAQGAVKRAGEAGWLHRLRAREFRAPSVTRRVLLPAVSDPAWTQSLGDMAVRFRAAMWPRRLAGLSDLLGVPPEGLLRLDVGWCAESEAASFPMSGIDGRISGFRLRNAAGRKFAVKGSREGIFLPRDLAGQGVLLVCEGPTDTGAGLGLGLDAVGRASCRGGTRLVVDLVRKLRPEEIAIIADNDPGGQGLRGGFDLGHRLALDHPRVRVVTPPPGIKDLRAWARTGATEACLLDAIRSAPVLRVTVRSDKSTTARAGGGPLG
jgi:hypothetical protein